MNRELVTQLQSVIPQGGGYDIQFNATSSGKPAVSASTVMITVFGARREDSKSAEVQKRITITGEGDSLEEAQQKALEDALILLGA